MHLIVFNNKPLANQTADFLCAILDSSNFTFLYFSNFQRLQDTKRKLERLNSYSKANTTWPYGFPSNSSSGRMLPTMGSRFPVKVVTSNHDVYDSQGCTVKTNMTSAERQEFDQVTV